MRPQVVLVILLVALAAFAGIFLLKKAPTSPVIEPQAEVAAAPKESTPIAEPPFVPAPAPTTLVEASPLPLTNTPPATINTNEVPQDPVVIQATIKRLENLQWNDDPASLQAILNELTNSSPIVRHAAIESTIQFRDRTAIPVLKDLAARTENPDEKKELIEAAEFLALPTISEAIAAKKAGKSINTPQQ